MGDEPTEAIDLLVQVIQPSLEKVGLRRESPVKKGQFLGSRKITFVGDGDITYTVDVAAYQSG